MMLPYVTLCYIMLPYVTICYCNVFVCRLLGCLVLAGEEEAGEVVLQGGLRIIMAAMTAYSNKEVSLPQNS